MRADASMKDWVAALPQRFFGCADISEVSGRWRVWCQDEFGQVYWYPGNGYAEKAQAAAVAASVYSLLRQSGRVEPVQMMFEGM